MKITFCAYDRANYYAGGPNAWLKRLLPSLVDKGFEVKVLFIISDGAVEDCPTIQTLTSLGIKCDYIFWKDFPYTEQRVSWITESIGFDLPDVFVPNLMLPAYYAAKWTIKAGIPTVGVLHSRDEFHQALIQEFATGDNGYKITAFVAVSKYIEVMLHKSTSKGVLIERIPCGVPLPLKSACPPVDELKVIYVGRLVEEAKRVSEVTRAFCTMARNITGTTAIIYGEGYAQKNIEKIIDESGENISVKIGGRIDVQQVQNMMLQAHVFVLLSEYEGLPIALMEAMACGLVPVCLREESGISELIVHNENGLIVEDREESFLNAIKRLKNEPGLWQRLSAGARATIEANYSHDVCVGKWINLFKNLKASSKKKSRIRIPSQVVLPKPHPSLIREDKRFEQKKNRKKPLIKRIKNLSYAIGLRRSAGSSVQNGFAMPFSIDNLDLYIVRTAILRAVKRYQANFKGIFLDVGCGRMPYKPIIMSNQSQVEKYIGMDLEVSNVHNTSVADIHWDGITIPLTAGSIDSAMATEVFEHCPDVGRVLSEIYRVLKPGGNLFFTIPFLWPLHEVPYDEYRYTPFAMERHLREAGFGSITIQALGGWNASLAQMIGLWVRRKPMSAFKRKILSYPAYFIIRQLIIHDKRPKQFTESTMITGIWGAAVKQ